MRVEALLTLLIVPFVVLATVLGWVAVGQIRRSGAKLRGLWLAVFDGLLFPLLGLFAFLVWFIRAVATVAVAWPWSDPMRNTLSFLTASLLFTVAAFFIVRGTWRLASSPAPPSPPSTARKVALGCSVTLLTLALLYLTVVVMLVSWNHARQAEARNMAQERMRVEKQEMAKAMAAKRASSHFGPVHEGLADRSGRDGLDLDSGRFISFDPSLTGAPDIELAHRWLQAESVDLFGDPNSFRPGILFMAVAPAVLEVNERDWDADPSSLLRRLPPPPPAGLYTDHMTFIDAPQGTGHPKTYLIRTQQGGAAIIQILGATDSRATMYRYKNILPGK